MAAEAWLRAPPEKPASKGIAKSAGCACCCAEWPRDCVHLRIWVWIAFESKSGLVCRCGAYENLPKKLNPSGNLQDSDAKSYCVFSEVRSMNAGWAPGACRAQGLAVSQRTCQISERACCARASAPQVLRGAPKSPGRFAPRERLLQGCCCFRAADRGYLVLSKLVKNFTATWLFIFLVCL